MLMLQILFYFTMRQIVHKYDYGLTSSSLSSHDSKENHWKLRDEAQEYSLI